MRLLDHGHHQALTVSVLLALLLTVVLAACRADDAVVALRLPSTGQGDQAVEIVVVDQAGMVQAIEAARGKVEEGVSPGGRPTQVVLWWLGGMCDVRTTLTVTGDRGALTIQSSTTTTTSGGLCPLAGVFRGVVLDLDHHVAPETISLLPAPA